jgi:hypothetical protein
VNTMVTIEFTTDRKFTDLLTTNIAEIIHSTELVIFVNTNLHKLRLFSTESPCIIILMAIFAFQYDRGNRRATGNSCHITNRSVSVSPAIRHTYFKLINGREAPGPSSRA